MLPRALGECGGRSNKIAFHDDLADLGVQPFDLERLVAKGRIFSRRSILRQRACLGFHLLSYTLDEELVGATHERH